MLVLLPKIEIHKLYNTRKVNIYSFCKNCANQNLWLVFWFAILYADWVQIYISLHWNLRNFTLGWESIGCCHKYIGAVKYAALCPIFYDSRDRQSQNRNMRASTRSLLGGISCVSNNYLSITDHLMQTSSVQSYIVFIILTIT